MLNTSQKFRLFLCALIFAYPILTGIMWIVSTLFPSWSIPQRTLIIVPSMVFVKIFFIIPLVHKLFGGWIKGKL